ncbi:MAG: EAL domain-containing protein, partial [Allopontixanthobacter sediminis]
TDRLQGFEALIRWEHPVYGGIGPDVFIPVIEKSGRIDSLTLFVIRRTLSDLAQWDRQRPGLGCAVNISARLLGDSAFVQQAIALVEQSEVANQQITFEVTETAALDDPELSTLALGKIRDTGIKISIDDYGTGQSTMSYLQRLPVDEIKIDQSFVKTVTTNRGNRVMVESTIEMAHALGLTVVAEGIEDAECMRLLHTLRCDIAQGWHISKPVSAEIIASRWIADGDEQARLMA